jgi:CBS domain-containing protein
MSAKLVKGVYAELRQQKAVPRTEGALHLFSAPVEDIAKGKLFTAPASSTVQEVARLMSDNTIGSLLLTDDNLKIVGIITDKDIRSKVVARGLDYTSKAQGIMSFPVQTISNLAVGFDALLKMMKEGVHHLAIEKNGEISRMITTHDIMVHQGTSPLYLFREIVSLKKIEGLYALSKNIPFIIRTLIEEGAKANNITRMITVLNDHILKKLLTLLQEELGPAPLSYCWLLVGSEGRREQTFKTDQDNGILYGESDDPVLAEEARRYFDKFAQQAIAHLVKCGYPLCPGDIMASNPKWRQPYSGWVNHFAKWCGTPNPQEVLNSIIFFDFRSGYGDDSLADKLRDDLNGIIKREGLFLLYLARNCLASRPPLTFFKNFIVEKNGDHKDTFDLKTKAIVFIVDFARVMALKYGINEVNTLDRLAALNEEYLSPGLCGQIIEAYEFLMHLRLVHQLRMLEKGEEANNHINPKDLSDLERQTLKEAFGVINRLQDVIRLEFQITDL